MAVVKCETCDDKGSYWDEDPNIRTCLVERFCRCPKGEKLQHDIALENAGGDLSLLYGV